MEQVFQSIIKKRIDDENISMFIFDAPTGSGKTYQIVKYIQDNYQNKKIFFIANLHNQIPTQEELTRDLNDNEQEKIKLQILRLSSIFENFKSHFKAIISNKDNIQLSAFFVTNAGIIENLSITLSILNDKPISANQEKYYFNIFYEQEKKFRAAVKIYIYENCANTKKKRKEFVQSQEWIRLLYPVIDIDDKNIILMTVQKFYYPIDPLYEKAYELSSKQYENAVIFFDEFDASKRILMDLIIDENANNYKTECFRLFRRLYDELLKWNIPKYLHVAKPKDGYNQLNLLDEINNEVSKIQQDFEKLDRETEHILDNTFKTRDIESKHNFIFSDSDAHTITNSNDARQLIYYVEDIDDKKVNIINSISYTRSDEKDLCLKSHESLNYLYQKVNKTISNFIFSYTKVIEKYMNFFNANKSLNDERMDFSSACNGMIEILNLSEENERFLTAKIMQGIRNRKARDKFDIHQLEIENDVQRHIEKFDNDKRRKKYDFYKNGFSYMEVIDSFDQHNLESKVYSYSYDMVPEKMIINLCVNYKLIGVSATATIPSILTNYDLTYFQKVLGSRVSFCSEEEHNRIMENYQCFLSNTYEDTEIVIDFDIDRKFKGSKDEKFYLKQTLNDIFGNEDLYILHDRLIDQNESYRLKDAADLYRSFHRFCKEAKVQSFIHFVNFSVNKNEIFKTACINVLDLMITNYSPSIKYYFVDSEGFNKSYDTEVIPALEKGEKVFIVTTYHTLGTGVNLKYKVTKDNIKYYDNLEFDQQKIIEKDFDGLYLSKPSNIFPFLTSENNTYHNFMLVIYALEFLNTVGSLKKDKVLDYIKKAFRITYMGISDKVIFQQDDILDITYGHLKYLIQAIGRICRTKTKGSKILILSCFDNARLVWKTVRHQKEMNLNIEFLEFSKQARMRFNIDFASFVKSPNEANRIERSTIYKINSYIYYKWTLESVKEWKELREFVLRYPTSNTDHSQIIKDHYIEFDEAINEYSYDGYHWTKYGNDMCEYRNSVSAKSARLHRMMQIPGLQNYFAHAERQYAIDFELGKYVMCTSLFQRIYKGALGEIAGRFILMQYQIDIQEIEDIEFFECFDFCYGDNISFDFKNWYKGFSKDSYRQLSWIKRKAEKSGYLTVFVINILYEGYQHMEIHEDKKMPVKIITIPWLYNVNKKVYNEKAIGKIKEEIKKCSLIQIR